MEEALIIFVRNAELGKVKTRIAKTAGNEKALRIYKALLQHTFEITKALDVDCFVFYSDTMYDNDIWLTEKYKKVIQQGNNLGDRMHNAFQDVFAQGYARVCIIGSDCIALNARIIKQAFKSLQTKNMVIGPALDGGYYLLGMQTLYAPLFQIKEWSSSGVFNETMESVQQQNLSSETLVTLSDIDTEEDWNNRHQNLDLPAAEH